MTKARMLLLVRLVLVLVVLVAGVWVLGKYALTPQKAEATLIEPIPCTNDEGCGACESCTGGFCMYDSNLPGCGGATCSTNEDCSLPGYVCLGGLCVPEEGSPPPGWPCVNNSDCGTGFVCINGQCTSELSCVFDSDCPEGQICANNTCQSDNYCDGCLEDAGNPGNPVGDCPPACEGIECYPFGEPLCYTVKCAEDPWTQQLVCYCQGCASYESCDTSEPNQFPYGVCRDRTPDVPLPTP